MQTATTCQAPSSVPVNLVSLETVYNVSVSKEQRFQTINLSLVGYMYMKKLILYKYCLEL